MRAIFTFLGQTDWLKRDLALVLTALFAGPARRRAAPSRHQDIRTTDDAAAVIHVKRKGGKERSVPIEAALLSVIEVHLDRLAARFPGAVKRKAGDSDSPLSRWQARSPLFVGRDGERRSRATLPGRDCGGRKPLWHWCCRGREAVERSGGGVQIRGTVRRAKRALGVVEAARAADHIDTATIWHNLGGVEHARGRFVDGEIYARRSVQIRETVLGPDHVAVAADLAALAALVQEQRRCDEAEKPRRRREASGSDRQTVAHSWVSNSFLRAPFFSSGFVQMVDAGGVASWRCQREK